MLNVFVPMELRYKYCNCMNLQTRSVKTKEGTPSAKMWKKHFHKEKSKLEKGSILISHRFVLLIMCFSLADML
jgi:hypothetical protein